MCCYIRELRAAIVPIDVRQARISQRGVPLHLIEAFPCHEYKGDPLLLPPVRLPPPPPPLPSSEELDAVPVDSDTVLPVVVDMSPIECSICLCEYTEGEMLRTLPCQHTFHQKCVDQWLQNHSTCCICRSSVLSHPVPLPLESSGPSTDGVSEDSPQIPAQQAAQVQQQDLSVQAGTPHLPFDSMSRARLHGTVSRSDSAAEQPRAASAREQGQMQDYRASWRGPAAFERGVGGAGGSSTQLPSNGEQQAGQPSWMQRNLPIWLIGPRISNAGQRSSVNTVNGV